MDHLILQKEITADKIITMDLSCMIAYSLASAGACGESYGVKILMKDGTLYHSDFQGNDAVPGAVKQCLEAALPRRGFAYLGLGNVLFFREEDGEWLEEELKQCQSNAGKETPRQAVLYRKWVDLFRGHYCKNVQ